MTTTADLDIRLETDRLLLCRWRPEDFDTYVAWLRVPDIARVLPIPSPVPDEIARMIFDQILALTDDQGAHYAIWRREPLRMVGGIGLGERNARDGHAGLSALIADLDARGNGFSVEAARAVIDHAFDAWKLRKVWLNHHGFNEAARAAADRLGFVEVGRQRNHHLIDGEWTDWVTMELWPGTSPKNLAAS